MNRSTQIPFDLQLRVFIREKMLNNYTKSTSIIKFRIIFYINGGVLILLRQLSFLYSYSDKIKHVQQ